MFLDVVGLYSPLIFRLPKPKTELKRKKIDEYLIYIEERLTELEQEKEELKLYQELDGQRRSVEYTLFHREQSELVEAISMVRFAGVQLQKNKKKKVRSTAHIFFFSLAPPD
jgi:chromosome segregation ATPase